MEYLRRAVDLTVSLDLGAMGAVLLEGARGCGKTETGAQHAKSEFAVDRAQNRRLAELNPAVALQGETPRLVDEWQLAPDLWNEIRHEIDSRRKPGQFIISGSATPADSITRHTGAGRISRIRMRPMALGERYPDKNLVTLDQLREMPSMPAVVGRFSYPELVEEAVRGGWPGSIDSNLRGAIRFVRNYVENLAHTDLPQMEENYDSERVRRLLRSVARNVSAEVGAATLAKDVSADGGQLSATSARTYLDALERIFIIEELPAWSGSLRSKSRLRKSPKLNFCDPSLAVAALRVGPDRLAEDPEYFGQVFESMVVRDLRTYAEQIDATCFGYRDDSGLEADLIIEFAEGGWAAVEVKLGESERVVDAAERNLLRLKNDRMTTTPEFMAIVTGGLAAYTLPSGIHVIPLSALGPIVE